MVYPDTNLSSGVQDAPYGGGPATKFGAKAFAWVSNAILEAQRQIIESLWVSWIPRRMVVQDDVQAGDVLVEDIQGTTAPGYCVRRLSAVTYDSSRHYFCGVATQSASSGSLVLACIYGIGLAPSVTGLPPGAPGSITFDTTTGKLRLLTGSEPRIGRVNALGFVAIG